MRGQSAVSSQLKADSWKLIAMHKTKIVVIVGPTAVGKSRVAMRIAEEFCGEIISADSMQVYRYMDIGTAKPSKDERERVRHHLIDIRDPDEEFNAAQFRDEASNAIIDIVNRGLLPIVAGGTGLYIKALCGGIFDVPEVDKGLRDRLREEAENSGVSSLYKKLEEADPEGAKGIDPRNTHRVIRALEVFYLTGRSISRYQREHSFSEMAYNTLKIGLRNKREVVYRNIDDRVDDMINTGLVDEVRQLLEMGYGPDLKAMLGIGYSQICNYLKGVYNLEEGVRLIKRDTRHYSKRQMTWFRRDHEITWFDQEEDCIGQIFSNVRGFVGQV